MNIIPTKLKYIPLTSQNLHMVDEVIAVRHVDKNPLKVAVIVRVSKGVESFYDCPVVIALDSDIWPNARKSAFAREIPIAVVGVDLTNTTIDVLDKFTKKQNIIVRFDGLFGVSGDAKPTVNSLIDSGYKDQLMISESGLRALVDLKNGRPKLDIRYRPEVQEWLDMWKDFNHFYEFSLDKEVQKNGWETYNQIMDKAELAGLTPSEAGAIYRLTFLR